MKFITKCNLLLQNYFLLSIFFPLKIRSHVPPDWPQIYLLAENDLELLIILAFYNECQIQFDKVLGLNFGLCKF